MGNTQAARKPSLKDRAGRFRCEMLSLTIMGSKCILVKRTPV